MEKKILILGAGGHTKVLVDSLRPHSLSVVGILDANPTLFGSYYLNFPILGSEDEVLKNYAPTDVMLINGIGSIKFTEKRAKIYNKLKGAGYTFLTIIHPTAYIGTDVIINEGSQCMAGSILQPGCRIGENVIINTRVSVDHDSHIGDHVHLAPGVVCCGNVTLGRGTHVGCGAVILQGVTIGENCLIAAGAVVTRDVLNHSKVAGVPAKIME